MRAARTDGNHAEIVLAWRQAGAFVQSLAAVGCGCVDALVMHTGRIFVVEIKNGAKCESHRQLTPAEKQWHRMAEAAGVKVHVVTSVDEALAMIGGGA